MANKVSDLFVILCYSILVSVSASISLTNYLRFYETPTNSFEVGLNWANL